MRNILVFFVLILAGSCTKYEKIEDFPIEQPKLVANCLFSSMEPFKVDVSHSLSVLDNAEIKLVNGAGVILIEDGKIIDTLLQSDEDQMYYSDFIPKAGKKYKLEVSHKDYESIMTNEEMLPPAISFSVLAFNPIDSLLFAYEEDTMIYSFNADVTFELSDISGIGNIYSIQLFCLDSVYSGYLHNDEMEWQKQSNYVIEINDPAVIENADAGFTGRPRQTVFLSDALFDGQKRKFTFRMTEYSMAHTYRQYFLHINSYTPSSFYYMRSLGEYSYGTSPFDEPSRIFTNIKNGYGIFSGLEQKEIRIR